MKEFAIYTVLRLGLFLATYAVLAGAWVLVFGWEGTAFVWPFVIALAVSMLLSLKLLAPQREALARRVEERAHKAAEGFERARSREDAD